MYLDYSKIKSGQVKQPVLRLQTLAGKELGAIPYVHNLNFEINYSDVSTIQFDVPHQSGGKLNYLYDMLTSYKVIYTEEFGIYVLTSPSKTGDGIQEVKSISGYSLEKMFERKKLFLEEGTYDFWNPASPKDTILSRIIELDPTWSVGYVDPKLIGCYRTFDQYDNDALNFCYGDAMKKYRCTIVFDVYEKTINAYDASESRGTLPIYLSYKNLVDSVGVEELSDDIVTKLKVYGADNLTIRDVNPIGTDYLIDLSYFISNGDLNTIPKGSTETLADRVTSWQKEIVNRQQHYTSLVAARSSKTAQRIAEEARLADLNAELEALQAQQSVTIQALALETTDAGKVSQQTALNEINMQISEKKQEITEQESVISRLTAEIEGYASDIQEVNNELSIESYFTEEERKILNLHLIEDSVEESTFVATDVDTSVSGASSVVSGDILISGADVTKTSLDGKVLYAVTGGAIELPSESIKGSVIRSTVEEDTAQNRFVLTAYLGATTYGERSFPSGMITISGSFTQLGSDVAAVTEDEVTTYKGSSVSVQVSEGNLFFTVNVNDYQKYSVAQELYAFGAEVLSENAWPIYEFSLSSSNFLFQKEFAPYKDELELGKAVYLDISSDGIVKANLIGLGIDFENPDDFSLTFSNRYQLKNGAETLADILRNASSTSRSFDTNKHIYNKTTNQATQVSEFMNGTLNAAVNKIVGAANQSVEINGSGIHVGGDSNYQLRIVDNMIAMTDDNWETAKLAIGLFATEQTGQQWGVNAELIAGRLYIGNNMVLENELYDENGQPTGVMAMKVDSTGAWLYNSTMVLQKDNGGKLLLDPEYGIVAGTSDLFTTSGTTVLPSFIDADGDIELDADGIPVNSNFYLDLRDGSAYFRGAVSATSGKIGGWYLADDYLYSGDNSTYVALNASETENSLFAIWAGAENPEGAPFWVKRDGSVHVNNGTFKGDITGSTGNFSGDITGASGTFSGVVQAADFLDSSGRSMLKNGKFDSNYLDLGNIIVDGDNGEITIKPGLVNSNSLSYDLSSTINNASVNANSALGTAAVAKETADGANRTASNAVSGVQALANGTYQGGTFINGNGIISPIFYASSNNDLTYGEYTAAGLSFFYDGSKKIVLDYSTGDMNHAQLILGQSHPAYIKKHFSNGVNYFWIGNSSDTCGIEMDFANSRISFKGTVSGLAQSVFTSSASGLVPASGQYNTTSYFLNGAGSWSYIRQLPSAPTANQTSVFLRGDGSWATPTVTAVFG